MLETFKNFLRRDPPVDFAELARQGAVIVDVRSKSEYESGHIKGSLNLPLDKLPTLLSRLPDKKKPIITCCASGVRSASAVEILKSEGYTHVVNGGGWSGLKNKL